MLLALGALPASAICPNIQRITPGEQSIEIAWTLGVSEASLVHSPTQVGDFAGYRVWLREDWTDGGYILLREYRWGEDNPNAAGYWEFEPYYIDSTRVYTAVDLKDAFPYTVSVTAFEVVATGESDVNESCREENAVGPVYTRKGPLERLRRIQAIPNPYRSSADWETGGERRVAFVGLPGRATIRIYTTAGDHVRTISHENPSSDQEDWDLLNKDNEEVAPGVYLWTVDAGDLGTTAGKIMIIK